MKILDVYGISSLKLDTSVLFYDVLAWKHAIGPPAQLT